MLILILFFKSRETNENYRMETKKLKLDYLLLIVHFFISKTVNRKSIRSIIIVNTFRTKLK